MLFLIEAAWPTNDNYGDNWKCSFVYFFRGGCHQIFKESIPDSFTQDDRRSGIYLSLKNLIKRSSTWIHFRVFCRLKRTPIIGLGFNHQGHKEDTDFKEEFSVKRLFPILARRLKCPSFPQTLHITHYQKRSVLNTYHKYHVIKHYICT